MWHVTRDMWHVTRDTWRDMWHVLGVNIFSKFQLPSSYGLWFMILWISGGKGSLNELMNEWYIFSRCLEYILLSQSQSSVHLVVLELVENLFFIKVIRYTPSPHTGWDTNEAGKDITVFVLWQEEGCTRLYFIVYPDSSHNTDILENNSSIDHPGDQYWKRWFSVLLWQLGNTGKYCPVDWAIL